MITNAKYDVIIVGGGPAGASVSYHLSSNGYNVLLLDRSNFPRAKACAGGLTQKTLQILPFSVEPIIRKRHSLLYIGNGNGKKRRFISSNSICAMTVREEFDSFCIAKSFEKGTGFRKIKKIESISEQNGSVKLTVDGCTLRCDYLVGADGANSTVRRLTNGFSEIKKGLAIEALITTKQPDKFPFILDFFVVSDGYGWVFPKDDHLNIGLYSNSLSAGINKGSLLEYIKHITGDDNCERIVGHHIGLNGHRYFVKSNRVFLIGDAAGMVDPLLGEGIYNAIRSGQLLASAMIRNFPKARNVSREFDQNLEEIRKDLASCHSSSKWFFRMKRFGYFGLTIPSTRYCLMKGFEKGMTFSEIKHKSLLLPFLCREKIRSNKTLNVTAKAAPFQ